MRVLVTGAGGQVGHELVRAFEEAGHHEVVACDRARLDVGDRDAVLQAVTTVEPDAVVNAAAWTAVDACEDDPDRAFRDNALAVRHLAEGCRITGAHLCHVSTDYVFDGAATRPYTEWDTTGPLSVYGRSKLAGEHELLAGLAGDSFTLVRPAWVFGAHGRNFVKTMLRLAAGGGPVRVVADQTGSPTCAADLAEAVVRLVAWRRPGLFHVTNQGAATWHDVAREVFSAAGHDPARVEAITTADYPLPARRPTYAVLDNAALRIQGLPLLPEWRGAVRRVVKELTS